MITMLWFEGLSNLSRIWAIRFEYLGAKLEILNGELS
jgi:hypothetical protein